jgi:hypothetical protein
MFKHLKESPTTEIYANDHHHHLLCWKSALGGLVIALMAFVTLSALGAGVMGFTAENLVYKDSNNGSVIATAGGLWLGISVMISLFCGSYFALRVSRFVTTRIGAAHGFVVASLFFGVLLMGAGNLLGGAAKGIGNFTKTAVEGAGMASSSPFVQDTVYKSFGTSNLKSDPKTVAEGLSVRLLQGDTESAKAYYAYQTGLSQSEVDAKVTQMQNDFNAALKRAEEKTAHAVGDAGICLFVLCVAGLIASLIGGHTGAQANTERPFVTNESRKYSNKVETVRV